ncbi:uncharacterized protein LOC128573046 [Nycticebus coucang]|uniref:uncharacterized protein LOC128573046 n=1 Tax=Nycticebus coucang TaxID=9470 RepID=UPI00234E2EA0|nr:uncharacterized protein LOC128573046 [Nycticebus coucang]
MKLEKRAGPVGRSRGRLRARAGDRGAPGGPGHRHLRGAARLACAPLGLPGSRENLRGPGSAQSARRVPGKDPPARASGRQGGRWPGHASLRFPAVLGAGDVSELLGVKFWGSWKWFATESGLPPLHPSPGSRQMVSGPWILAGAIEAPGFPVSPAPPVEPPGTSEQRRRRGGRWEGAVRRRFSRSAADRDCRLLFSLGPSPRRSRGGLSLEATASPDRWSRSTSGGTEPHNIPGRLRWFCSSKKKSSRLCYIGFPRPPFLANSNESPVRVTGSQYSDRLRPGNPAKVPPPTP